jgi:hypothetical protein
MTDTGANSLHNIFRQINSFWHMFSLTMKPFVCETNMAKVRVEGEKKRKKGLATGVDEDHNGDEISEPGLYRYMGHGDSSLNVGGVEVCWEANGVLPRRPPYPL